MISSSFEKPSVTPTTMLFTSVRVRPCSERFSRSSSGRSTMSVALVLADGDRTRDGAAEGALRTLHGDGAAAMLTSTPPGR
jgi:hypothetical protein